LWYYVINSFINNKLYGDTMDEIRNVDESQLKKQKILSDLKDFLVVIIATVLYTVSTYYFVLGKGFAPSGLSGVLAMIEAKNDLQLGTFVLLLLNAPLLIACFFTLSKRFAFNTTISVLLMCLLFFLLDKIDKNKQFVFNVRSSVGEIEFDDFGKKLLSCVASGICAGVSIALTFRAHGCLGGVDIAVSIIQKYKPRANVSLLLAGFNLIIIVASFFVFEQDPEAVCFAVIYIVIFSKVCEYILNGVKKALKFEVVTEQPEALSKELIEKLGHSVTVTPAHGMYKNRDKYLLICVIRSRQIGDFEKILKKYPDSFAFASSVSEVFGTFFK